MSLNPSQRYQSVDDFVQSLQQQQTHAELTTSPANQSQSIKEAITITSTPPSGNAINPILWILGLGTAVLLLAIFAVLLLAVCFVSVLPITRQASSSATVQARNDTIATVEAQVTRAFGPSNATLWHKADELVETDFANVSLKNFIAEAQFTNPYSPATGSWDYGFMFRHGDSNQHYWLSINSNKSWDLIDQSGESTEFIDSGTIANLMVNADQNNEIKLICDDDQGWLFVNDEFVTELDLSSRTNSGDVLVVTGLFNGDEIDGEKTHYTGFNVWSLP
jgi:hypothetical protein